MSELLEAFRIGLRSLSRNPGRTGLTVLGLGIGIAAFIAMVSFGQGARSSVVQQFAKLGVNMLTVKRSGSPERPPAPLDDRDVERLLQESTSLERVVPVFFDQKTTSRGERRYRAKIYGTTPEYVPVRGMQIAAGGMFDAIDLAERSKVCVLGATPAEELFGREDPLGKTFTLDEVRCRVVGLLAQQGSATSGRDLDDLILIPNTTYRAYVNGEASSYAYLHVQPFGPDDRDIAWQEVSSVLRMTHNLSRGEPDDFVIRSPDDATQVADDVAQILTGLLAGIAGVSLLVGGIGIMNIQLVAVAERTREIGIRAAIGASPSQIRLQFLIEALLLALVGTILGALLGLVLALGVAQAMRWPASVPLDTVAIAVAFGSSVGILFGFLPAQRASQLDPIEALRRE